MTDEQGRLNTGGGVILGALVGDAAGATLEFPGRAPTPSDVQVAMQMSGGGRWCTAPGQVTDDGELALCLMHALSGSDSFDIEAVAAQYLRWLGSDPFDRGATTATGLSGGRTQPPGQIHQGMWKAAALHNGQSKANGGLMRIAPLGVWGYRVSEEALVEAACRDSRLTHSNTTCQHAAAVYCLAIRHLMLNPQDSEGALATAVRWARELGSEEVSEWLGAARRNEDVGYLPHAGFVKYGFTHAFRHLILGTGYLEALRETLSGGGDTDTNACIVGAVVGALHGIDGIPEAMREAVLRCDTFRGRPRPEFLQTRVVLPGLLDGLC